MTSYFTHLTLLGSSPTLLMHRLDQYVVHHHAPFGKREAATSGVTAFNYC